MRGSAACQSSRAKCASLAMSSAPMYARARNLGIGCFRHGLAAAVLLPPGFHLRQPRFHLRQGLR